MSKRKAPTGTTRVEVPEKGTFGWLMRIRRGEQFFQEFYSDSGYGGKRGAQRAARARYRELAEQLPPAGSSEGKLSSRNRTGHVGVRLAHSADPRGKGHVYDSYVAFWRDNGRDVTMRFACGKYGAKKALAMAAIARESRSLDRDWIEQEYSARLRQRREARAQRRTVATPARKSPSRRRAATTT